MGVKAFADTNVVLYLLSDDARKAECVEALLPSCLIGVQVLNEIANVARRKFGMSWTETNRFLYLVRTLCPPCPLTIETHERARIVAERYGLSFFDALIVAAALLGRCDTLYSEDMQHGLLIDRQLRICNPFRKE
ncbi:MAG: PIN domain-containing protein [Azoarcus sp.]|jgi:predicted nucleic acid-binding protein|nr:PIN domain-containing protein [Azoarcus sp.]